MEWNEIMSTSTFAPDHSLVTTSLTRFINDSLADISAGVGDIASRKCFIS